LTETDNLYNVGHVLQVLDRKQKYS